jgi:hypothetical protein
MNLQSFFDPIPEFLWQKNQPDNSFLKQIHFYAEEFPDLKGVNIALVGLKETRGVKKSESIERASSEIREKLFELKKGLGSYRIVDLGDLISGQTLPETYQRIQQVGEYL